MIGANEVHVSRQGMLRMAKDQRLRHGDIHRVLMHLIGNVKHLNWLRIRNTDIGKRLGIKPLVVAQHLKTLGELGYISGKNQYGEPDLYRLSHEIAWKGTFEELKFEFPDDH